jgi:hypothetical protein
LINYKLIFGVIEIEKVEHFKTLENGLENVYILGLGRRWLRA